MTKTEEFFVIYNVLKNAIDAGELRWIAGEYDDDKPFYGPGIQSGGKTCMGTC